MIVTLEEIVNGVNVDGLPSLEDIKKGYRSSILCASGDDNPRLFCYKFFTGADYFIEAAKCFEGKIIVDLGVGERLDGYVLAQVVGARGYVAVESFNISKYYDRLVSSDNHILDKNLNEILLKCSDFIRSIDDYDKNLVGRLELRIYNYLKEGFDIPIALVAEDMVSALKRFPNNSVNVLTAGLDKCILWREEYAKEVEREISRVVSLPGFYLSMCSRLEPKGMVKDSNFSGNTFEKFSK